jgi:hypothetical protein
LRETHFNLGLRAPLLDADADAGGEWVALSGTSESKAFRTGASADIEIPVAVSELSLHSPGRSPAPVHVGAVRIPMVRRVSGELALIVEPNAAAGADNAWLVWRDGSVERSFHVGDAIGDVLIVGGKIVVTYFDEGVFSFTSFGPEGVMIFDLLGNPVFGYRTQFGDAAVDIADVYGAGVIDERRIAFSPYTEFPLVVLDIESRTQVVRRLPELLHGARAISGAGDVVLIWGPSRRTFGMFRLMRDNESPEFLGDVEGRLRGIECGRFLRVRDGGFDVIEPLENPA